MKKLNIIVSVVIFLLALFFIYRIFLNPNFAQEIAAFKAISIFIPYSISVFGLGLSLGLFFWTFKISSLEKNCNAYKKQFEKKSIGADDSELKVKTLENKIKTLESAIKKLSENK